MVDIPSLWLPILLSGALVWIASLIAWAVLPYHKSDYRKIPDEEVLLAALQPQDLPPGHYVAATAFSGEGRSSLKAIQGGQAIISSSASEATKISSKSLRFASGMCRVRRTTAPASASAPGIMLAAAPSRAPPGRAATGISGGRRPILRARLEEIPTAFRCIKHSG